MTHPYLQFSAPVAVAHRGGALEAPENTMRAFGRAVALGYDYLETDVRATSDGVPVVFHDEHLHRVTDRGGVVRELPHAEVSRARIGGSEPIPTLDELLEEFPDTRFNIDIKEDHALEPTLAALSRSDHLDRVCIASFSWSRLRAVRARFGAAVCTNLAPAEVAALAARARLGRLSFGSHLALPQGPVCVQVPRRASGVPIVTEQFIRTAHSLSWPVFVWTIDSPADMNHLLDLGVDGIMTDRPTVLKQVIRGRNRHISTEK